MTRYKLTYFDLRGRAEVARQLFALAGVPYEDHRISFEEWPSFKPKTPFGQLPLLEVDGIVLAQSMTIARFLARRFGFAGANDWEGDQIDALSDTIHDYYDYCDDKEIKNLFSIMAGRVPGDKDAAYKELFEPARDKYFPIFIEKYLKKSGSGFLVGSKISYVDLVCAAHIGSYQSLWPHAFDNYPELLVHKEKVESIPAIKKWIETRPKNPF